MARKAKHQSDIDPRERQTSPSGRRRKRSDRRHTHLPTNLACLALGLEYNFFPNPAIKPMHNAPTVMPLLSRVEAGEPHSPRPPSGFEIAGACLGPSTGLANSDNHITNEVSPLGPGGFKM